MSSSIQVWRWSEKWAKTSHFCNKLCCVWRNSFGYTYGDVILSSLRHIIPHLYLF